MKPSGENAPFFVDNEEIRLTQDGIWIADGIEISHEPTRRLFARSLEKDAQGYRLVIGRETKRIRVEDTAYFIHRIDGDASQGFVLWISDGTQERLKPGTLRYRPGRLTCLIRGGEPGGPPGAPEEAKFLRAPYLEILRPITRKNGVYWLEIEGEKIRLAE